MNNNNSYPQMQQNGQQMYQASDGKWYPIAAMPQSNVQPYGPGQYYGQQPMNTQQPIIVDQGYGRTGGGMGVGGGLLAGLCAGLLCFDLGACLC